MRPVLFTWFGWRIHSYPALLYVGLVCGVGAANLAAHRTGVEPAATFMAQLALIPAALVGARIMYVACHRAAFAGHAQTIFRFSTGGADMFGGLPVVLLGSLPLLASLGLSFWRFWDVSTFTVFVGMAFTRVGCLLNGCCAGRATASRWGVRLPDHTGAVCRRVPTQALEAGCAVAVLAAGTTMLDRGARPGAIFLTCTALYAVARVALDPMRADRHAGHGTPTLHQLVYGTTAAICLLAAWAREG